MYCRKDFMDLTTPERNRLAAALNQLYDDGIIETFAQEHDDYFNNGIHWGPAFLPWHRHWLLRLEAQLKTIDARIALPFWDWTRSDSQNLDDGDKWGSFFGGRANSGGLVGPWDYSRASSPNGVLPSLDSVIDELQAGTFAAFRAMEEGSHARPHVWTGGTMNSGSSPADPIFYLHHCNVDRLWAIWQRNNPGAIQYTIDECGTCARRVEAAFVPLNDPMVGGATPASMLDHTTHDYYYPRDDAMEARALERGLPAIISGDLTEIELLTPQVVFNSVPEGDTTKRAALFQIEGCESLSFEVANGPTGPFSLFSPGPYPYPSGGFPTDELRIWLLYTGGTPGSTDSGVISLVARDEFGDEVGRWDDIPILANSVARPAVAVALVLDESGSMLYDAGNNRKRLEVLQLAATTFIDQLYDDNGLALVSFANAAEKLTDLQVAGALTSPVRNDARSEITVHGPPDIYQHTSIGAGLEVAADVYNTSPIASDFDVQATIVFTDGFEDREPLINDVESLINERVYAVGVADAANVRNDTLRALADNTGGFMLVTGAIGPDDEFLLEKFFIQILAGVTNRDIVSDPGGSLIVGQIARVPFSITRSDIAFDAIALSRAPQFVVIGLETPDGTVVDQTRVPAGSFRAGTTSSSFRIALPLVIDGKEHWEGKWQLLLALSFKQIAATHLRAATAVTGTTAAAAVRGTTAAALPYHALIHARSNLRLRASIDQSALTPGSQISLRAVITEYGQPIETHPQVTATMTRPDTTTQQVSLLEAAPGEFDTSVVASQSGVYRFQVQAVGFSSRGQAFSREHLLTAVVGRQPSEPTGDAARDRSMLCDLLRCLAKRGVVTERLVRRFEDLGLDVRELQRCLADICRSAPNDQPRGTSTGTGGKGNEGCST